MMNLSKNFMLLIFLVTIISISAVSAESFNDNSTWDFSAVSAESFNDNSTWDLSSSIDDDISSSGEYPTDDSFTDDDMILANDNQNNLKSAGLNDDERIGGSAEGITGSFRDLEKQINDTEDGGILDLSYDFAYSPSIDGDDCLEGIWIEDKSITINGNGHAISGRNISRIFTFDLYGGEVTLNDITLAEGFKDNGGAVYVYSDSTVNFNYVKFFRNSASKYGGAIYSEGEVHLDNSVFDDNRIELPVSDEEDGGAAIYNYGTYLSIINCRITNNMRENDDESNYLAGALVTYSTTDIKDSYFANNSGSVAGAILSSGILNYDGILLNISNTTFEANAANFGGAILANRSHLEIDNCTFVKNNARGFGDNGLMEGGAILVCPGEFTVKIRKSTFAENSAKDIGGALVLNTVGESSIDNCRFNGNSAKEGGAIYVLSSFDIITISNSEFSGNIAENGSAILNDGSLEFYDNVINSNKAEIYNRQGDIGSELKIIIFNNQTISAQVADVLPLTATFIDDNANLIYDPYFRFCINNETIEDMEYVDEKYCSNYTILSAGELIISSIFDHNYDYGQIKRFISIANVQKLDLIGFEISSNDEKIVEGENLTISIKLIFGKDISLNTRLKLYLNETEYEVGIINNTAQHIISDLVPGKYHIKAIIESNSIFNDADSNQIDLTVLVKLNDNIFNLPISSKSSQVVFSMELPKDAAGTFALNLDGKKYSTEVINGFAQIKASDLTGGKHNLTVSYSGDGKYSSLSKSSVLAVSLQVPIPKLIKPKDASIVYSNKYTYKVCLSLDGKPVAGKTVMIKFRGINFKCVTGKKGYAILKINTNIMPKAYAITASYGKLKVLNKIKIVHLITASAKKAKPKTFDIIVKLKKSNGKYLKSKKVKLVINGRTHILKTNKYGVAKFRINKRAYLKLKRGKVYKYLLSYGNDKLTKKFRIV